MSRRLVLPAAFLAVGLAVGGTALAPAPAAGGEDPVYTGILSNTAVGGYDPVSYFKGANPVKGKSAHTLDYMGAEWRFASAENLEAFKENPELYAPQYGGYCAWAVSQGYTAKGDPQNWKIVDGKLYLNYNADIQQRWERSIPEFIAAGDQNWPRIIE